MLSETDPNHPRISLVTDEPRRLRPPSDPPPPLRAAPSVPPPPVVATEPESEPDASPDDPAESNGDEPRGGR